MAKSISTPVGNAPLVPVALIAAGGYLMWFGVHYWRQDIKWPSDPVKAILTGKGLPAAVPVTPVHDELAAAIASGGAAAGPAIVGGATGNAISDAAMKYNGLPGYVFG